MFGIKPIPIPVPRIGGISILPGLEHPLYGKKYLGEFTTTGQDQWNTIFLPFTPRTVILWDKANLQTPIIRSDFMPPGWVAVFSVLNGQFQGPPKYEDVSSYKCAIELLNNGFRVSGCLNVSGKTIAYMAIA